MKSRKNNLKYFLKLSYESSVSIEDLQDRLIELGFNVIKSGQLDQQTISEIMRFQILNDLGPTGVVNLLTEDALFSENAKQNLDGARFDRLISLVLQIRDMEDEEKDTDSEGELDIAAEELSREETGSVSETSLYSDLYSRLKNRNLCIAMVANAIGESALDPGIAGDCGDYARSRSDKAIPIQGKGLCCSYGLWQYNICGGMGIDYLEANGNPSTNEEKLRILSDYSKQVDYMVGYLQSRYSSVISENRSIQDFTEWFVREIERPADPDGAAQKRIGYALDLDSRIV